MSLQLSKRETCNYLKEILIFKKKILRTKRKFWDFDQKRLKRYCFLEKLMNERKRFDLKNSKILQLSIRYNNDFNNNNKR